MCHRKKSLHRGLKRNIFTLNIHYSQPIFREYSLFFAYFNTNIHYSLKKVDVPGYTIFRSTKREGPDKLYCSKDKISYKVQTCSKTCLFPYHHNSTCKQVEVRCT